MRNEGYKVDNIKGRIALDIEWNAKDGNLDRDIGAYRALYDAGLIDAAVMISRTHDDLRALAVDLAQTAGLPLAEARKRLSTSTTTNYNKLMPRVTRGDLGGCPFLGVFICGKTWDGEKEPIPDAETAAAEPSFELPTPQVLPFDDIES